jgi:hypothetical protein
MASEWHELHQQIQQEFSGINPVSEITKIFNLLSITEKPLRSVARRTISGGKLINIMPVASQVMEDPVTLPIVQQTGDVALTSVPAMDIYASIHLWNGRLSHSAQSLNLISDAVSHELSRQARAGSAEFGFNQIYFLSSLNQPTVVARAYEMAFYPEQNFQSWQIFLNTLTQVLVQAGTVAGRLEYVGLQEKLWSNKTPLNVAARVNYLTEQIIPGL